MQLFTILTISCCCVFGSAWGKIINAYEKHIVSVRASFYHLINMPSEKGLIKRLPAFKEYILYYELTEALLQQFRSISPSLYMQIDTITDHKKRPVDVYVKFIPTHEGMSDVIAMTNVNQQKADQDGYLSEFGQQTVSIRILIVKHSLMILAHEFGHVSYQVPNLASYVEFFSRNYLNLHEKAIYLGHKPNDPSGQKAKAFERQFKADMIAYHKSAKVKPYNPVILLKQFTKMLLERD